MNTVELKKLLQSDLSALSSGKLKISSHAGTMKLAKLKIRVAKRQERSLQNALRKKVAVSA